MTKWWFLIVALVVWVAVACQRQEGEQVGTTEETPTVDPAEVEQTIRGSAERYEQAALAGDQQTLTSFYADDAILLPAGLPRAEGIEAIRSTYQKMYADGNPTVFSIDPQTIVVSEGGDLAYEIGTYSGTFPMPGGATVTDTGKYLVIWKPTETGEWKIAVETWNSDQTPGTPPAEETTQPAPPAGQ